MRRACATERGARAVWDRRRGPARQAPRRSRGHERTDERRRPRHRRGWQWQGRRARRRFSIQLSNDPEDEDYRSENRRLQQSTSAMAQWCECLQYRLSRVPLIIICPHHPCSIPFSLPLWEGLPPQAVDPAGGGPGSRPQDGADGGPGGTTEGGKQQDGKAAPREGRATRRPRRGRSRRPRPLQPRRRPLAIGLRVYITCSRTSRRATGPSWVSPF